MKVNSNESAERKGREEKSICPDQIIVKTTKQLIIK